MEEWGGAGAAGVAAGPGDEGQRGFPQHKEKAAPLCLAHGQGLAWLPWRWAEGMVATRAATGQRGGAPGAGIRPVSASRSSCGSWTRGLAGGQLVWPGSREGWDPSWSPWKSKHTGADLPWFSRDRLRAKPTQRLEEGSGRGSQHSAPSCQSRKDPSAEAVLVFWAESCLPKSMS